MASGFDARIGIAKETTYGTRVAPSRFIPATAEDFGFTTGRYYSPAIGTGMWGRPSVTTTQVGSGSLSGDVMTAGFGFLLDGLHGNVTTPVQQGATAAYLQTHTLNSPPGKSYSAQVQVPPVGSSTLLPHDMSGIMWGGITLSWTAAGVLSYEFPAVYQSLDLTQTLATYTPPSTYSLFSFKGGSVTIGGVAQTDIIGDGSVSIAYPLRDDAFPLGGNGKIAKPVITDKPTGGGSFGTDYNDNVHLQRTLDNTVADVVLKFEGVTIASTYKQMVQLTLPDCVFTTSRPTVGGPGPVSQTTAFETASATGNPPVILYQSADLAV